CTECGYELIGQGNLASEEALSNREISALVISQYLTHIDRCRLGRRVVLLVSLLVPRFPA
ncbi:MAG: hypothetical protein ACJ70N_08305, partial [Nitrososphaera sp.]